MKSSPILSIYEQITPVIKAVQSHRQAFTQSPSSIAQQLHLTKKELDQLFLHWADISFQQFQALLHPKHLKHILSKPFSYNNGNTLFANPIIEQTLPRKVLLQTFSPSNTAILQQSLPIYYHTFDSPFGTFFLAVHQYGICQLHFGQQKDITLGLQHLRQQWPNASLIDSLEKTERLAQQIFAPANTPPPLPLCLVGTDFQLAIWKALLDIPMGELQSYGQLAATIRQPKASQAVGTAVGKNAVAYLVPCHRIVNQTGKIGHFRWGSERKAAMLAWELRKCVAL